MLKLRTEVNIDARDLEYAGNLIHDNEEVEKQIKDRINRALVAEMANQEVIIYTKSESIPSGKINFGAKVFVIKQEELREVIRLLNVLRVLDSDGLRTHIDRLYYLLAKGVEKSFK